MNERLFGKGFYQDAKPAFSSGHNNEDPLLMEIRRRNLERDPDFYKKDVS